MKLELILPNFNGDFKNALKHLKKALENAPNAASIGRVQAWLEENNLAENTIVMLMGDNGFLFGEHGLIDKPVVMEPGEGYRGLKELKMSNQLREYNDLECLVNGDIDIGTFLTNIAELETAILSYSIPRFHVLRVKGGSQVINNVKLHFSDRCDYINYDSENKETVNQRRKSIGLEPIETYAKNNKVKDAYNK